MRLLGNPWWELGGGKLVYNFKKWKVWDHILWALFYDTSKGGEIRLMMSL